MSRSVLRPAEGPVAELTLVPLLLLLVRRRRFAHRSGRVGLFCACDRRHFVCLRWLVVMLTSRQPATSFRYCDMGGEARVGPCVIAT